MSAQHLTCKIIWDKTRRTSSHKHSEHNSYSHFTLLSSLASLDLRSYSSCHCATVNAFNYTLNSLPLKILSHRRYLFFLNTALNGTTSNHSCHFYPTVDRPSYRSRHYLKPQRGHTR